MSSPLELEPAYLVANAITTEFQAIYNHYKVCTHVL